MKHKVDLEFLVDDFDKVLQIDKWCREKFFDNWTNGHVWNDKITGKRYARYYFRFKRNAVEFKLTWL